MLDDNFGAGADRNTGIKAIDKKGKGKAKVDAEDGEDVEWESEDENGEDEEDDDGGVNINKFENSHEACKMVSPVYLYQLMNNELSSTTWAQHGYG